MSNIVGNLSVFVDQAKLDIDVSGIFSSQDPYCEVIVGKTEHKTKVCEDVAKTPKWGETFTFTLTGESPYLTIICKDDNVGTDEVIGKMSIPLNVPPAAGAIWYDIFTSSGKKAGAVLMNITYTPPQGQFTPSPMHGHPSYSAHSQPSPHGYPPQQYPCPSPPHSGYPPHQPPHAGAHGYPVHGQPQPGYPSPHGEPVVHSQFFDQPSHRDRSRSRSRNRHDRHDRSRSRSRSRSHSRRRSRSRSNSRRRNNKRNDADDIVGDMFGMMGGLMSGMMQMGMQQQRHNNRRY